MKQSNIEHTKEKDLLEQVRKEPVQPDNSINPSVMFSLAQALEDSRFYRDAKIRKEQEAVTKGGSIFAVRTGKRRLVHRISRREDKERGASLCESAERTYLERCDGADRTAEQYPDH